ncbi:hypothetical protein CAAN3_08S05754 [[Candida] anglica]
MSHQEAIKANIKAFAAADAYDSRECMQVLSMLAAKTIVTHDVSIIETQPSTTVYGNPEEFQSGISLENLIGKSEIKETFDGKKVMDFACGTGLVTEKLTHFLDNNKESTEIVGIDINQQFLNSFNEKATKLSNDKLTITSELCDILDPERQSEIDSKYGEQFDAIFCSVSYHHLEDYVRVTKKLVTFLKKGTGVLYILDFYNEDVEREASETSAVRHMGGLKVEALTKCFQSAGLGQLSIAKEFAVKTWQLGNFIENHCRQETIDRFNNGTLEKKSSSLGDVYSIEISVILAVGVRPKNDE